MNQRFFIVICLFLLHYPAISQRLTLQQCIDSALTNNIGVKQNKLLVDVSEVNWRQSKANQLPDLNANANHGINQGRSIDPFTNTYINQSINYAGYGINSGVVLFNGMNLQNTVRQNATALEASKMELQQTKDNLVLNVILAYLQVLNNEDQLSSTSKQAEISQKQLERLEILDKQGAISPSQVSDVRGQLMNDQLAIVDLRSALENSKLNLTQLMNVPYNKSIVLERIDVNQMLERYAESSSDIYQNALQQFSQVKAVELRTRSAEYALKAAKGQLYPTVSLSGNVQTNYSSAAQNAGRKIAYNEQLGNNVFSGLNLGVRIPIFNGFQVKNRIRLADIELKNNELIEENTKIQLRQQIQQAYLNMTNAYERYKVLLEQVKAYEQSFRAAEARFNGGVGNSVDFLIAKNNLDRANINLISATYDYALRTKILDYYNGKELK